MAIIKDLKNIFIGLITKWRYYNRHRNPNVWVMGEWYGERCCDNSAYFANYVSATHKNIEVYWLTNENVNTSFLHDRITKLIIDSPQAIKILKTAGVVIFSQSIKDLTHTNKIFIGGAMIINFWHGAPWKKIGSDAIRGSIIKKEYSKLVNKLIDADYYLAYSAPFVKIMSHAYNVDESKVFKAGYPRNSLFYSSESVLKIKKELLAKLEEKYKQSFCDGTKIVAYMPSFRDFKNNDFTFKSIENNPEFYEIMKKHNAILIQKAHYVSNNRNEFMEREINANTVFNVNSITAQELLAAADILITDYSGAFFDYLLLDRPIIHYIYDYDYYKNQDRGLYFDKEDVLCGDEAEDIKKLLDCIENNLSHPSRNAELRNSRRSFYSQYESSDACHIIYDEIISRL